MALGEPDVERMLRRFSARQFARWMWYEQVEPFGELRADYRAAQIVANASNIGFDTQKRGRFTVEECLLSFVPRDEVQPVAESAQQSPEEMAQMLNLLVAIYSVPGEDL